MTSEAPCEPPLEDPAAAAPTPTDWEGHCFAATAVACLLMVLLIWRW